MKKFKSIVAMLLTLAMLIASVGTIAFATETTIPADDIFYQSNFGAWIGDGKAVVNASFAPENLPTVSGNENWSAQMISGSNTSSYTVDDANMLTVTKPHNAEAKSGSEWITYIPFDTPVSRDSLNGKIAVRLSVSKEMVTLNGTASGNAFSSFGFYSETEGVKSFTKTVQFSKNSGFNKMNSNSANSIPAVKYADIDSADNGGNANGYYDFRIELSKGNDTIGDYWYSKVISEENDKAEIIYWIKCYEARPEGEESYDYTNCLPAELAGFGINLYTDAAASKVYDMYMKISDMQMYYDYFYSTGISDENIYYDGGIVRVHFESDVLASSVSTSTITLTDSATGVNYAASAEADGNSVLVTANKLEVGKKYTLNVTNGVTSADGEPVTAKSYTVTATNIMLSADYSAWSEKNGAPENEYFAYSNLEDYSGNTMIGVTPTQYKLATDETSGVTRLQIYREAGSTQNAKTYVPFTSGISKSTFEDTLNISLKVDKDMREQVTGTTAAGYTFHELGFYYTNGSSKTFVPMVQFQENSGLRKINGNSANQINAVSYADFDSVTNGGDGDGYYEFRIELSSSIGTNDYTCWYSKVISEEDGTNNGTVLHWLKCYESVPDSTSSSYGNLLPETIEGFGINLYTNGTANSVYNTNMTFEKMEIYHEYTRVTECSEEVYYDGGTIDVTFNNDVSSDILSGITVKDESGTTLTGVTVTPNGNIVTLSFENPLIADKDYTVTISGAATQTYTVRATAIMMDIDFTKGLDVGTVYTPKTISQVHPLLGAVSSGTGTTYTVEADCLTVRHTPCTESGTSAGAQNEMLSVYLPEAQKTGSYAIELVIKDTEQKYVSTGSGSYRNFSISQSNSTESNGVCQVNKAAITKISINYFNKAAGADGSTTLVGDSAGDYRIKFVVSRTEETDPWAVGIYDLNADAAYPIAFSSTNKYKSPESDLMAFNLDITRYGDARKDTATDILWQVKSLKMYKEAEPAAAWGAITLGNTANYKYAVNDYDVTWFGRLYTRPDANGNYPKVILAAYDADGNILGVTVRDDIKGWATGTQAVNGITLSLELTDQTTAIDHAKLMILDNYNNVAPLIDCITK